MDLDAWTWAPSPTNSAEFDAMMSSLDTHLAAAGLQPFQRGLNAERLVAIALELDGIPFPRRGESRHPAFGPSDLLGRVHEWYDANYGKRMHMDMSPGSVVFRLNSTLWRLRMPKIYGRVQVFLDQNLENKGRAVGTAEAPATLNLLLSIDDMTAPLAARLRAQDFATIAAAFGRGYNGLCWLEDATGHDLFDQARQDYRASVSALMSGRAWNDARWDMAQCAEKTFKGLLGRAGHQFPTNARDGHDIVGLGALITKHFGTPLSHEELKTVHCPPKVRYSEVETSEAEALSAHDALLQLLGALALAFPRSTP